MGCLVYGLGFSMFTVSRVWGWLLFWLCFAFVFGFTGMIFYTGLIGLFGFGFGGPSYLSWLVGVIGVLLFLIVCTDHGWLIAMCLCWFVIRL